MAAMSADLRVRRQTQIRNPRRDDGEHPRDNQPHVADGGLQDACDDPDDGQRQADEAQHFPVHLGLLDLLERLRGVFRAAVICFFGFATPLGTARAARRQANQPGGHEKLRINARENRGFSKCPFPEGKLPRIVTDPRNG